jgi:hypothetical protein
MNNGSANRHTLSTRSVLVSFIPGIRLRTDTPSIGSAAAVLQAFSHHPYHSRRAETTLPED